MEQQVKRALISVSDKSGIVAFARELVTRGYEILSSGGTHKALTEAGVPAIKVAEVTGFPEILGGRVKTLHPKIHGAILACPDQDAHRRDLEAQNITPISLTVVNLYPFKKTIADPSVALEAAIEQIDIGGPTLIRASAKNFRYVTVLTDPEDYAAFLAELDQHGAATQEFRANMARKAFQHTFSYDLCIADYLDRAASDDPERQILPDVLRHNVHRVRELRYGENPHQKAALYVGEDATDVFTLHQGKPLSFNNLVDMESAWRAVLEFDQTAAVIVKHTNPCGVACQENLVDAFVRARTVDPVSSFGGVIAVNREMDEATARAICENFAELVIAPGFTEGALKRFKKKKNLRVLTLKAAPFLDQNDRDIKVLRSGVLVQQRDEFRVAPDAWRCMSKRKPTDDERKALEMAWKIVIHVKSNAIVYADADGALGIGAGQMSRVDSAKIALQKAADAGLDVTGCAMASDAFFPFRDSIDAAAEHGIRAIVEPGGSIRDEEVIQAADEHDMVLFFTGTRHFKH